MLELHEVTVAYEGRPPVLDRVNLDLDEGELVLVAGRTGSGKSSLLGVLSGLVPAFTGGTLTGDVVLEGRSVVTSPARERVHVVGHVGQDPLAGFVADVVEEELAYGMEQLGVDPATMRRRIEETLDLLGMSELRRRDLRSLSGGQQQRVAIGSVLTMHPRVLVLDEPTSALDPTAAEEVLATLSRLVHDLGVTVVLAEHRLERVVPFADRMVLLGGDGTLRVGEPADLLVDSPVAPPLVELGRWAGWSPLPLTVRDARRRATSLSLGEGPTRPDVTGETRLEARGVCVDRGSIRAVRGVDLSLEAGQVTGLMGRNGSGKSSLLWALQGSGSRSAGSVTVDGHDPAVLSPARRRHSVGLVPQTASDLLYLETVGQECAAVDQEAGVAPGRTRELLDSLVPGIPDDAHPRDLSEGQRLALVLAVVLAGRPQVLLLDEPTRGLDYPAKAALVRALAALARDGHAVMVATHDVEFVAQSADRVVVLADGEVVSAGPTARVVAESPAFAPQLLKVLGHGWMRVEDLP